MTLKSAIKHGLAGVVLGLAVAGLQAALAHRSQVPPTSDLMMLVVYSDNTVKSSRVHIDVCAAVAELALDGKVLVQPADEDQVYAMTMTCAPEALICASFGRRHTP